MAQHLADQSERNAITDALRLIPDKVGSDPFVWECVVKILNQEVPFWKRDTFLEKALRNFLLKCYFESISEPDDMIAAFSDFGHLEIADSSILNAIVPLNPIKSFLLMSQACDFIHNVDPIKLLEIVNSIECKIFRQEYLNTILYISNMQERNKITDPEYASKEIGG